MIRIDYAYTRKEDGKRLSATVEFDDCAKALRFIKGAPCNGLVVTDYSGDSDELEYLWARGC